LQCGFCQLNVFVGMGTGTLKLGGVNSVGGDLSQPRFIHNESGRFECRFTNVERYDWYTMGIWEGRAYFPDEDVLEHVVHSELAIL